MPHSHAMPTTLPCSAADENSRQSSRPPTASPTPKRNTGCTARRNGPSGSPERAVSHDRTVCFAPRWLPATYAQRQTLRYFFTQTQPPRMPGLPLPAAAHAQAPYPRISPACPAPYTIRRPPARLTTIFVSQFTSTIPHILQFSCILQLPRKQPCAHLGIVASTVVLPVR